MCEFTELQIFCKNIADLRKMNAFTKKEMAEKLGISSASVSLLEQGIVPPQLGCSILSNIYQNFGVAPKDIFCPLKNDIHPL